jgi:transposase
MEKGVKKTQSITDVSDVFGVSERIVYRIIKRFEQ